MSTIFIGLAIAYLVDPIVIFFERVFSKIRQAKLRRVIAVVAGMACVICAIVLFFVILVPSLIDSTKDVINNFGLYFEKIQSFTSARPTNIKFYVEVSGSMNGFFRSNKPTNFKTDVWSVFSDFASSTDGVNIFFQQNANPRTIGLEEFRNKMNAGAFVSGASTDVPDMLDRILNSVDCKKSEVGILVSDMKYDPVGNAALKVLLQQYSIDIRNKMANAGKALCLIVAKSDFLDKSGNVVCEDSPYYYLVIGKPENVVWIRNFVCTLLKHHGHYVDAVEWGIDYKSPKVKISDPDYLNVENRNCL